MLDLNRHTIKDFLNGLNVIENKEDLGFYKLITLPITKEDQDIINKSIELRNLVNEVREVNKVEKFQRSNPEDVNLKAMIGEYMFSKLLLKLFNNKRMYDYQITVPAIAEMILNRKKQDFEIIYTKQEKTYKTFDIKSQFKDNSFNYLTVNINSFNEMKKKSKSFIACIIDKQNNTVTFYIIKNDWFEQKSFEVLEPSNPNNKKFTPYRKMEIKKIYH